MHSHAVQMQGFCLQAGQTPDYFLIQAENGLTGQVHHPSFFPAFRVLQGFPALSGTLLLPVLNIH